MKDNKNYDLGIIGGMGTEATVELFRRITERTYANCDQDYMRVLILNDSKIPDRSKSIKLGSSDPLDYINEDIKRLEKIGVKYFIIPCNTAHYYAKSFKSQTVEFINMISETLMVIKRDYSDKRVCILGTDGTIYSGVYFDNEEAKGLKFLKLSKDLQDKVMNVVTLTKEGKNKDEIFKILDSVITSVKEKEKDVLFVLACTEISLYKDYLKSEFVIDAMDVLVDKAITKCGYKLKERE